MPDYELKRLRIREFDNHGWMGSLTLEIKTHIHTSACANEWCCSMKGTLVASDEIQVNVMQNSVV